MPCFEAHQPIPPSSSPPVGESSFVSCHVSKLTNLLLPFPPLQQVSPHLLWARLESSLTDSYLFIPSPWRAMHHATSQMRPHFPHRRSAQHTSELQSRS